MYAYFTKWLKQKYPQIGNNLLINKNRLSTPYDLHATLQDILYFNSGPQPTKENARGLSWFRLLPLNRTCESAGIPNLFCSCLERKPLLITDPFVQKASEMIVKEILHLLKPFADVCATLNLKTIDAAFYYDKSQPIKHEQVQPRNKISNLQVSLTTTPGGGQFEANAKIYESTNSFKIDSDINRINLYGNQSACITDYELRNYYLCKNSLVNNKS